MTPPPALIDRIRDVEWLVLDVDGVLTDGAIVYDNNGVEIKSFHVRDGSGLKIWHHLGKRSAVITGRESRIVEIRAAELGIGPVYQGASLKLPVFRRFMAETSCRPEQICVVGDDVPDLGLMANAGLAVAVADACAEARAAAHYIAAAAGGRGAVREVVELILAAQGLWHGVVDRFRREAV
jgi:YrbI family 3-deoxy-D-manno-octulosonate 8-phosphate phosphatase